MKYLHLLSVQVVDKYLQLGKFIQMMVVGRLILLEKLPKRRTAEIL